MKTIKKLLVSSIALLTVAMGLAGCGSNKDDEKSKAEDGKKKVTFWTWTPTESQFKQLKKSFDEKYPDIEIDWWRTAELSDYQKKLQVALAGGEGPDVFGVQVGSMLEQYSRFAQPMDELADKYMDGWKDKIAENVLNQTTTSDGTLAAMPVLTTSMEYYLYNKTLLEENGITKLPETYEELISVSKQLQDKGLVSMAMGAKDIWHDVDFFVYLANQFAPGKIYEAQEGKAKFTDESFVKTMEAWKSMFDDKVFQDGALGTGTYPDARDNYFYARKSAFFPTGSWHVSVVIPNDETKGTAVENDELGMASFPQVGPEKALATNGVDFAMCVNKTSKNTEAAMKFVDFMTLGDGQQIWVNTLQGTPVNSEIKIELPSDASETAKESVANIEQENKDSKYDRKLKYAELEEALGVAMQDVISGKDISTVLKTVEQTNAGIER
ncbi:ABC transporter substrate-binding protein [Enterococcus sp. OL5]|uniref:ABC transporter substrate-binding protein n=1 Tax=Enterococcus sp. OL5 TaxID=2590214 RepID=UPI00112AB809|nr:extracellular solute-binding protein [Enterococcus sp. OL5]TPR56879.1 extracellular solute-binding protein [Enterococcus sp. OL5]